MEPPTSPRRVHFVGVGGAGLSALAHILLARGVSVSGSDRQDGPRLDRLRAEGARVHGNHDAAHIGEVDLVVASSAIAADNPELVAARARGIPIIKRDQWLPEVTRGYDLVAVAGTHGKTTTTAMLTLALVEAGLDPTAVIGAEVHQLQGNARVGAGPLFVLEADEYDGAFSGLSPYLAVLTSVEFDHPDYFTDERAVYRSFAAFVGQLRPEGSLVACGDDPGVRTVLDLLSDKPPVISYGLGEGHTWQATDVQPSDDGGSDFAVVHNGTPRGRFHLRIPGVHNVRNALAVLAAADQLGVPPERARPALASYTGAARRFELVGQVDGIQVVDDYAHHPTAVTATLAAARQRAPDRPIWVVFQPHTYSRTTALLDDFAVSFTKADRVYVVDIYAAREQNTTGVHATDLVKRIAAPPSTYAPMDKLAEQLVRELPAQALVLTLGAGDITYFGPRLCEALRRSRWTPTTP